MSEHSGIMEMDSAVRTLGALAHGGRLEIFRRLIVAGPEGMAAGDIAKAVGCYPNTLSSNVAILHRAGLVSAHRDGRSIRYAAAYDRMAALLGYLVQDCCNGAAEICVPLAQAVTSVACCDTLNTQETPA